MMTWVACSYIKFAVYHGCGPKIAIKKKLQSSVHELQIPLFYTGECRQVCHLTEYQVSAHVEFLNYGLGKCF